MKILDRLFSSRTRKVTHEFNAPVAPDAPFYVVGDVHGCDGLLSQLLEVIEQEDPSAQTQLVFVGDYVDRGEDSAAVLRRLFGMVESQHRPIICLAGNHEDMMLKFIDDPVKRGARWLKFGGLQALASFGVRGISTGISDSALTEARDRLVAEMGDPLLAWLRALPTVWQTGNVAVVHAGADPEVPIEMQESSTLKWGHRQFSQMPRKDGVWVVHGHTVVDQAEIQTGRVAIDTGAYATGNLTAAYISADGIRFLSA